MAKTASSSTSSRAGGARGASTRPASRSGGGRSGGGRAPSNSRSRAAEPDRGPSLPARAARGIAGATGGTVRAMSDAARDLEPEHRRDGAGFILLVLALIVALREWWHLDGIFGDAVHAVVAGTLGRVALVIPVVLLFFALRMFRRPDDMAATNRMSIGTVAMLISAAGITHLVTGAPDYSEGAAVLAASGGVVGFMGSAMLSAAITPVGAYIVLGLLGIFGFLVLTRTPVHRIPDRLREVEQQLFDSARFDEVDPVTGEVVSRRQRRSRADLEEFDGDVAFEQAAEVERGRGGRSLKAPAPKRAARPTDDEASTPGADKPAKGSRRPAAEETAAAPKGESTEEIPTLRPGQKRPEPGAKVPSKPQLEAPVNI